MAPEAGSKRRVTIIGSDPIRRIGLCAILNSDPNFEVSPRSAPADAGGCVVLLGSHPGSNIYGSLAQLRQNTPGVRVIIAGGAAGDEGIFHALTAGAKGYVDEAASPSEFKQAIRAVGDGLIWAPRRVLSMFVERAATVPNEARGSRQFSKRELEVLQLLAEGCSNRDIGAALGIEIRTVKAHLARLMNKAGMKNRIALTVYAVTHAIIPPNK